MNAEELGERFALTLQRHALSAQSSEYDRSVVISAIAPARAVINAVAVEGSAYDYGQQVITALDSLRDGYNDPDGEYTNGRGPLGSLAGGIAAAVNCAGKL
ncbi:MAG: hypothetical protein HOI95_15120 [Chromatiales bacterium]|jgi:hypothetical protein|nr:hypothetical protein [Chromatiales bacterium]